MPRNNNNPDNRIWPAHIHVGETPRADFERLTQYAPPLHMVARRVARDGKFRRLFDVSSSQHQGDWAESPSAENSFESDNTAGEDDWSSSWDDDWTESPYIYTGDESSAEERYLASVRRVEQKEKKDKPLNPATHLTPRDLAELNRRAQTGRSVALDFGRIDLSPTVGLRLGG